MSLISANYPFYTREKTAIFIDGVYLYNTAKALDFDIDYKKLLAWAGERGQLLRANYYTVLHEDQEYSPIRPLVDWLNYNGFRVVAKTVRDDASTGRRRFQDMHVEMTVDAMEIMDRVDHVYLFSGDGNLTYLVQALQKRGIKVTLFGTLEVPSNYVSDDLRRNADYFYEMEDMLDDICREEGYSSKESAHDGSKHKALPEFIDN